MLTLCISRVVEPANQELASAATPESIHNNADIIEIEESATIFHYIFFALQHSCAYLPSRIFKRFQLPKKINGFNLADFRQEGQGFNSTHENKNVADWEFGQGS